MEYFSVDRIEGDSAVLVSDSEKRITVSLNEFPFPLSEGTVVSFKDGVYVHEEEEEKARKNRIFDLQQSLFGE